MTTNKFSNPTSPFEGTLKSNRSFTTIKTYNPETDMYKAKKRKPSIPVSAEIIKKSMIKAFSDIKLDCYNDILRIKQPSANAFRASQMLCKLVLSFRGSSQKNNDGAFQDWKSIQEFVHQSPNVMKLNQEIT